jgi:hypothetical protein
MMNKLFILMGICTLSINNVSAMNKASDKKDYDALQEMNKAFIFSAPNPFHGQSPSRYISETYPKPVHIRTEDARRLAETLQLQANTRAIVELRRELNDIKRTIGE